MQQAVGWVLLMLGAVVIFAISPPIAAGVSMVLLGLFILGES